MLVIVGGTAQAAGAVTVVALLPVTEQVLHACTSVSFIVFWIAWNTNDCTVSRTRTTLLGVVFRQSRFRALFSTLMRV